jgi:uncharacterized protein YndB with AHSA1/START domain
VTLIPSFGVSRTFATTVPELWRVVTSPVEVARWAVQGGSRVVHAAQKLNPDGLMELDLQDGTHTPLRARWRILRYQTRDMIQATQYFVDEAGILASNPWDPGWPKTIRMVRRRDADRELVAA